MVLIALAILLAIGGALIRSAIKVDNPYIDHRKAGTILLVSGLLIGLLGAAFVALGMAVRHDRFGPGPMVQRGGYFKQGAVPNRQGFMQQVVPAP